MIHIISFIVHSIIMMGILFSSLYIFMKSIQYTATMSRKIIAVVWCLLWSFLYEIAPLFIPLSLFRPLVCLTSIIFVFFLTRQKFETVVSAYLLSYGMSHFLHYIAIFMVGIVSMFLFSVEDFINNPIDYNQPIYILLYTIVAILQLILAFLLFRIRRFRKGFPFIFKRFTVVVSLIFTGITFILVTWVSAITKLEDDYSENALAGYLYIIGVLIAGIGIYILIRRLIKNYQKKRVQQNTDNHFERLLSEEQEKNKRLSELNQAMQMALHKFTRRIEAMETAFEQGNVSLKDIQNLQKGWQGELSVIKGKKPLSSTNITAIDNMFEYFAKLFAADEISFNLIINGSIIYMIENIIDQGKLETLIGDHLKDAQIAVNSGDNPFRSIMAVLGLAGGHYEFTVFDSGIPFEVDTLERLGVERVTTHTDEGGNGIGFLTTFETMKEYNASLIISEQKQSPADYSKSVSIRFDDKNQYLIQTYRSDEFAANGRYMIVDCCT